MKMMPQTNVSDSAAETATNFLSSTSMTNSSESNVQSENCTRIPLTKNQSTGGSNAFLITPPNIHISHMYIYNFTPDSTRNSSSCDSCIIKLPSKYQSPATSSGPICRICHEGDEKEDLVSPCRCTGTVGLVHQTCMERWLSTRCSANDRCEICNYTFATIRSPKSVFEWIRSDENNSAHRRSLLGDITCFFLLTPLAIVSSFLCFEGAKRQVIWGNSLEAGCLMALATFLVTIYFVWNILTIRFYLKSYLKWRSKNHNVKLVKVQRVSTGNQDSQCAEVFSSNNIPSNISDPVEVIVNSVFANV